MINYALMNEAIIDAYMQFPSSLCCCCTVCLMSLTNLIAFWLCFSFVCLEWQHKITIKSSSSMRPIVGEENSIVSSKFDTISQNIFTIAARILRYLHIGNPCSNIDRSVDILFTIYPTFVVQWQKRNHHQPSNERACVQILTFQTLQ